MGKVGIPNAHFHDTVKHLLKVYSEWQGQKKAITVELLLRKNNETEFSEKLYKSFYIVYQDDERLIELPEDCMGFSSCSERRSKWSCSRIG